MLGASVTKAWRSADDPGSTFIALIVASITAAGCARGAVSELLHEIDLDLRWPPFRPQRPVLICNPKSGGGKVGEFDLVGRARAMGVEVVVMEPGDDLEGLARAAVERGADCLAMAGGDGSQALVASVAIDAGLPFVCISAGTYNHFALDLGLDRDDPSTGLEAFRNGVLRRIDVGRIGDRLFVNNLSLGVYPIIVDQEGYRDDRFGTIFGALPDLVGEGADPVDLRVTGPDGQWIESPFLALISNNPYAAAAALIGAQRPSLTTGQLGVVALTATSGAEAAALVLRMSVGLHETDPNIHRYATRQVRVDSDAGEIKAAVDGETITLHTPVTITVQPRALTVLVPASTQVVTAERHYRSFGVRGLWDLARGREPGSSGRGASVPSRG
jgi:diacylglycerol kinase family enzyme